MDRLLRASAPAGRWRCREGQHRFDGSPGLVEIVQVQIRRETTKKKALSLPDLLGGVPSAGQSVVGQSVVCQSIFGRSVVGRWVVGQEVSDLFIGCPVLDGEAQDLLVLLREAAERCLQRPGKTRPPGRARLGEKLSDRSSVEGREIRHADRTQEEGGERGVERRRSAPGTGKREARPPRLLRRIRRKSLQARGPPDPAGGPGVARSGGASGWPTPG